MKLTIEKIDKTRISIEVEPSYTIADLKMLLEVETGVSNDKITLTIKNAGIHLEDQMVIQTMNFSSSTVLVMSMKSITLNLNSALKNAQQSLASKNTTNNGNGIELQKILENAKKAAANPLNMANNTLAFQMRAMKLMEFYRSAPSELSLLKFNAPVLYDAITKNDIQALTKFLHEEYLYTTRKERVEEQLKSDPNNKQLLEQLEEFKREDLVAENRMMALEYMPEVFGSNTMLYVDCEVNNVKVRALIDSGAQVTCLSQAFATKADVMKLVDKNFKGMASGVGTSKIAGKVHMAQIKIGNDFFGSSLTIIEELSTDCIFGLDMMKRHQCKINLKDNVLEIGGNNVPFVSDMELTAMGEEREREMKIKSDIAILIEMGAQEELARSLYMSCEQNIENAVALYLQITSSS